MLLLLARELLPLSPRGGAGAESSAANKSLMMDLIHEHGAEVWDRLAKQERDRDWEKEYHELKLRNPAESAADDTNVDKLNVNDQLEGSGRIPSERKQAAGSASSSAGAATNVNQAAMLQAELAKSRFAPVSRSPKGKSPTAGNKSVSQFLDK